MVGATLGLAGGGGRSRAGVIQGAVSSPYPTSTANYTSGRDRGGNNSTRYYEYSTYNNSSSSSSSSTQAYTSELTYSTSATYNTTYDSDSSSSGASSSSSYNSTYASNSSEPYYTNSVFFNTSDPYSTAFNSTVLSSPHYTGGSDPYTATNLFGNSSSGSGSANSFVSDVVSYNTSVFNNTQASATSTLSPFWASQSTDNYQEVLLLSTIMDVVANVHLLVESKFNASNSSGGWYKFAGENGTTSPEAEPPYKDFYETAQFVTGLIVYPTICLYGLLGNIFILIVLAHKNMTTSTNVYLSALAVSDIIKLINDSLYFLTILLLHTNPVAGNLCYGYLYPYAHFIFNLSVCVSSWLTVSVAVERYLLVCHPTKSKAMITIPRAKMISFVIYVIMIAIALPSALRYQVVEKVVWENGLNRTELDVNLTELWQNESFATSFNWLQSLLRSILPLFVLIVMNAFIINALRKTRANKKMAQRNKITVMLIIVIIFFVLCIIPDAVMSGFFNLGYAESDDFLVRGVREITDMLLAVNAAINFTLYMIFNKIFRDQFVAIFCHRCVNKSTTKTEEYRRLGDARPTHAQVAVQTHAHANGAMIDKNAEVTAV